MVDQNKTGNEDSCAVLTLSSENGNDHSKLERNRGIEIVKGIVNIRMFHNNRY